MIKRKQDSSSTKTGPPTVNLGDYTEVDGIQATFSMSVSMGDLRDVLIAQFDEVKHGMEIEDAILTMPK